MGHRVTGSAPSSRNLEPMENSSVVTKVYGLVLMTVVSAVIGLLVSGLVLPLVLFTTVTAKATADTFEYLPAELETPPQSERSKILLANGETLATFYAEDRTYVPLKKISKVMQDAQIAIEDHRFFEHGAVDPIGVSRAFVSNLAGRSPQGASTLTQQYVKLVRMEAAAVNGDEVGVALAQVQTVERKILEMRYAIALERRLNKEQILERYLNIAYYGDGSYGVESAARHYFGTTAEKLTLDQAAMLAGIVKNPSNMDPIRHPNKAIERRNIVLARMLELNYITQAQHDEAKAKTFDKTKVIRSQNGCVNSKYPFLCDYVYRTLLSDQMPGMGATREERKRLLLRGGITVHTLINSKAQDAAQKAVTAMVKPTDPVISVATIIQPKTGLIVAMAQSRPSMGTAPGETYYNYAATKNMGGAEGYQAGSTFKAFTLAAALEQGMSAYTTYDAKKSMDFKGQTFESCDGPFKWRTKYTVNNSTGVNGVMDAYKAAAWSVNTYFMQLEQAAGICNTVKMAEKLGVKKSLGGDMVQEFQWLPSFTLGSVEVSPLSMTEAYATLANRGVHCNPIIVKSVINRQGKEIAKQDAGCQSVLKPSVADAVNNVLANVMNGTGRPARIPGGYPQAGKTGTIDGNKAVWFAGFTPEMAGSAMIAIDKTNPYYKTHRKSLKGVRLPSGKYLAGSGGGDAGRIYRSAMASALQGLPKTRFANPNQKVLAGKKVAVPSTRGMSLSTARSLIESAGFRTAIRKTYSDKPAGSFLYTSPNNYAPLKSTVFLVVSMGPRPAPKPVPPTNAPVPPPAPPPGPGPGP